MVRFARWTVTALIVALIAGSCGGGSENQAGDVSSSETESQTPGTAEEVESCIGAPAASTTTNLIAKGMAFKPATIKARAGQPITVRFTNKDSVPHTFTVDTVVIVCDTNTVAADDSVTVTFELPGGETGFVCTIHPSMTGKLIGT